MRLFFCQHFFLEGGGISVAFISWWVFLFHWTMGSSSGIVGKYSEMHRFSGHKVHRMIKFTKFSSSNFDFFFLFQLILPLSKWKQWRWTRDSWEQSGWSICMKESATAKYGSVALGGQGFELWGFEPIFTFHLVMVLVIWLRSLRSFRNCLNHFKRKWSCLLNVFVNYLIDLHSGAKMVMVLMCRRVLECIVFMRIFKIALQKLTATKHTEYRTMCDLGICTKDTCAMVICVSCRKNFFRIWRMLKGSIWILGGFVGRIPRRHDCQRFLTE